MGFQIVHRPFNFLKVSDSAFQFCLARPIVALLVAEVEVVHQQIRKRGVETFLGNLNRDIRAANSLMQSIRSAIRGLQRWIADLNEKKQLLLDALEKAKEPTLSDLLVDYFNLRNEQRNDWFRLEIAVSKSSMVFREWAFR